MCHAVHQVSCRTKTHQCIAGRGELTRAGFSVPPGFCLTTDAYRTFVAASSLQPEILRLSRAANAGDPVSLKAASTPIRALFTAGQIPPDLASEICDAYAQLRTSHSALPPTFPVAVRFSATRDSVSRCRCAISIFFLITCSFFIPSLSSRCSSQGELLGASGQPEYSSGKTKGTQ